MLSHKNLSNKVAVITGGSGVLCSKMALELSSYGVKIAILNRSKTKGKAVVEDIKVNGGQAISLVADVLDKQALIQAKKEVIAAYGKIDILINGAGGNHPDAVTSNETYTETKKPEKSFFHMDEKGFNQVFSTNFTGTFLACQVFGEALLKQDSSTIINISSMSAFSPMTKVPAYSAAKSAINNFTMWMAVHFADTNLRVNSIAPGFFLTEQNRDLLLDENGELTERSNKIISQTPMNRFGTPEDLLGTVLWLVDETYSGFVTGITVPVDGGFMSYSGV